MLISKSNAQVTYKSEINSNIMKKKDWIWKDVNWKKIQKRLDVLQTRIYTARKNGRIDLTRKLQKIILNSHDIKKLAVRKITQHNRGKNTPGIDGKKN
jgi:RNA-directed DNA polymerase